MNCTESRTFSDFYAKRTHSLAQSWRVFLVAFGVCGVLQATSKLARAQAPASAPITHENPITASPEDVAVRLRELDAANQDLARQFKAVAEQNRTLTEMIERLSRRLDSQSPQSDSRDILAVSPSEDVRAPDPGQSDDELQPPDVRTDEPAVKKKKKTLTVPSFGEGFEWETDDGEFSLQFHNETQLDMRTYADPHPDPVNQFGFYIPRMRMIFNGRLTKPIEYAISINKGTGSLDLLDAYLNFNYDNRLQLRFGRFRVPFTYDWYALSNQFLTTPERSVYAINQGYNRNVALMLHGEILDESMEYAFAAANGPRNSYFDTNAGKDLLAYGNIRPFMHNEAFSALKYLNLGGSGTYGLEDQDPLPVAFRTSANASESAGTIEAAPAFLQFFDGVTERGIREQWELHAAWYYKQLSVMAAWDHGFNDYHAPGISTPVRLRSSGYHMQFGYFLTGEEIQRRTFVEPLCPFDLRPDRFGLGAFEIQARYDHFEVGKDVFASGLADPNAWTNRVNTIDSGINWYLNKYLKVYFDWQHSMYANPVLYKPNGHHKSSDLFWLRCQVYF